MPLDLKETEAVRLLPPLLYGKCATRLVGLFQDLSVNIQGGLWLSALVLSGVNPKIIQSYKTVMGIVSAMADDFTVFFFAFVVTHLLI